MTLPLEDFARVVQARGIRLAEAYRARYWEVPTLPARPEKVYADWPGWRAALGTSTASLQSGRGG